jgi:maltooligosyltrehalose trehalohydrolase
VILEVHVGAFTPEGTFRAAIGRLDHLVRTGITAVRLMPVADVPGGRNRGSDGVDHFGPDGNHLATVAPHFTERHHTPWGAAIDHDGPQTATF